MNVSQRLLLLHGSVMLQDERYPLGDQTNETRGVDGRDAAGGTHPSKKRAVTSRQS